MTECQAVSGSAQTAFLLIQSINHEKHDKTRSLIGSSSFVFFVVPLPPNHVKSFRVGPGSRGLQPRFRITAVCAQVVYQESDDEQRDRTQTHRHQGEEVTEGVEFLGTDDGDQGRRPARWVQGSG